MPRLVAAPDKFRGTATAHEAADAIVRAATSIGWAADAAPMSDGGEGFVDVLGGELREDTVRGPLGAPTTARWSMLDDGTAIVESAAAAGRALLASPVFDQPLEASTHGVGELLAVAQGAGARRIVVGVGGTASTDGGQGCIDALGDLGVRLVVPVVAACDVLVAFGDAPSRFGPQKGATKAHVATLEARLAATAEAYATRFGVDVRSVPGAGAGGGLAGGLIALGATVALGARYVATSKGLDALLDGADLVVTGEGALDDGSLEGKVVGTVLGLRPALRGLVVAGRVERRAREALVARHGARLDVVALAEDALDAAAAIESVVTDALTTR